MTKAAVEKLVIEAQESLVKYKDGYLELDENSPIKNITEVELKNPDRAYDIQDGLGEEYGLPYSKGGRYIRRTDIDNLFSIGIRHSRDTLIQNKFGFNKDISNIIGGYPKGSFLQNANGLTMVSQTGNNTQEPPVSGNTEYWHQLHNTPLFASATNDAHISFGKEGFGGLAVEEVFDELPMTNNVTKNIKLCSFRTDLYDLNHNPGIFIIPDFWIIYKVVGESFIHPNVDWLHTYSDTPSSVVIRISQEDNLYEYSDVASKSIVCHYHYKLPSRQRNRSPIVRSIPFPLYSGKMYYLYLEYVNGKSGCTFHSSVYPFNKKYSFIAIKKWRQSSTGTTF